MRNPKLIWSSLLFLPVVLGLAMLKPAVALSGLWTPAVGGAVVVAALTVYALWVGLASTSR